MEKRDWIQIEGEKISLEETPQLFRDLNIIPIFLRRYFEKKYTNEIIPDKDEQVEFQKKFMQNERISDRESLDNWLISKGIKESDLNKKLFDSLRLEKFKENKFSSDIEPLFLKRKSYLDRVTYSLLRVKSRAKAAELHLRLQEEESTFPELASKYSEGVENLLHGLIGPIELGQTNQYIAERLRNSTPGKLWPPFELEGWWILIRHERLMPATLNAAMRLRLINELYENWIREKIKFVLSDLDKNNNEN